MWISRTVFLLTLEFTQRNLISQFESLPKEVILNAVYDFLRKGGARV